MPLSELLLCPFFSDHTVSNMILRLTLLTVLMGTCGHVYFHSRPSMAAFLRCLLSVLLFNCKYLKLQMIKNIGSTC